MKQNNNNKLSIEIYQPKKGLPSVEVHISEETVWLTQAQIAPLFPRAQSVISRHANKVFASIF